jgi:predicted dehydrogenase
MFKSKKYGKFSVLVIGCGSIGERHIFNLKSLGIENISIYDENQKRTKILAEKYHVNQSSDILSGLSSDPDFSIVSTPPISHLSIAKQCLKYNSHIFLEKPLSHELKGIKSFLTKADSQKIKVGVGYNFRFNPGLIFIKNFLKKKKPPILISSMVGNHIKNWRPNSNYKHHYVLKKGGGIILDASHEYDFIRWILDDKVTSVFCQSIKTPKLSKTTESLACIFLKFQKGTIANLVLDYVRPSYQRKMQIINENYEINWNFQPNSSSWKKYDSLAKTQVTYNHQRKDFNQLINKLYKYEIQSFLNSIINNQKPIVDGWDAFETLKIGIAALTSSHSNKIIKL